MDHKRHKSCEKKLFQIVFYVKEWKGSITALQLPLLSYRVADDFGFTLVGIDHAGPFFVKTFMKVMVQCTRPTLQLYCYQSYSFRTQSDLHADSLFRALNGIKSRRGIPALVVLDIGRTLKIVR